MAGFVPAMQGACLSHLWDGSGQGSAKYPLPDVPSSKVHWNVRGCYNAPEQIGTKVLAFAFSLCFSHSVILNSW